MIQIRQPFFSITTAAIFGFLAVLYGASAANGTSTMIGTVQIDPPASWALTGLMFLMAYFALVHMKHDKK